jgi:RNA recognition motif-containing protein
MMKRLFVGNLCFAVAEADLEELFAPHGKIERTLIVMNRETQSSRGFGFVSFKSEIDAIAARNALHGTEHRNRIISVDWANDRFQ